jgi:hypothetical protein
MSGTAGALNGTGAHVALPFLYRQPLSDLVMIDQNCTGEVRESGGGVREGRSHERFMSLYHESLVCLLPAVPLAETVCAGKDAEMGVPKTERRTSRGGVGYSARSAETRKREGQKTLKENLEVGNGGDGECEEESTLAEERLYQEFRLAVDSWAATMKLQRNDK